MVKRGEVLHEESDGVRGGKKLATGEKRTSINGRGRSKRML